MEAAINIEELLSKPVWQMTGQEFCELTRYANSDSVKRNGESEVLAPRRTVKGTVNLAQELGCCAATISNLLKEGVLKRAVVSHVGRAYVFDVDIAIEETKAKGFNNN
ncbi:MAG: DUF3853 family protein [Bacteroidales bacterium]|nr:DUF3853 family protein [Bacteroidales bacterium]